MKSTGVSMKTITCLCLAVVMMFVLSALLPSQALAQMPARFYWKSLSGANALPLIVESINGNTNPFDPADRVTVGADIDGTLALPGYAHTFSLFDRSAMAALIVPMGRVSSDVTVNNVTTSESASGYGDPMLEFDINLIGPKAQKNLADALRYEPGFSVDLLADLVFPIGEYDNDQSLNIGQNRWYGRVGAPIIYQIGSWVPGQRTTLEFLPSVWLYGDNNDFTGKTLETDPIFQLDAHLTRDLTEHLWASLDGVWKTGGEATVDGVSGDKINILAFGPTIGYTINDNLNLTFGYKATVNDSDPGDMKMDGFMISFVYGWHPLIEGSKRLQEGE
jgi:hypothetical protein